MVEVIHVRLDALRHAPVIYTLELLANITNVLKMSITDPTVTSLFTIGVWLPAIAAPKVGALVEV